MSVTNYLKELGKPVGYYPKLARALDSVNAAVFLCQLLYWSDKGHNPDGWIYKTQAEVEEETGLTRRRQESVRKHLTKLGVLEEARRGTHGTLHFRVNGAKLDEIWCVWLKTPMAESAIDERRKAPNANGGKRHTLIKVAESTTENTTEKLGAGAPAAPHTPAGGSAPKTRPVPPPPGPPADFTVLGYLQYLARQPAYDHIDPAVEESKVRLWHKKPGNCERRMTARFLDKWVGRIERPLKLGNSPPRRRSVADPVEQKRLEDKYRART